MKGLKTIVCIKGVPDPEGPKSAFSIRSDEKRVVPVGIPPVINPYDENALEVAIRLKEQYGGTVIALNVSAKASERVLKKALSVGADDLILLEDPAFSDLTSRSTAEVIRAALKKTGGCDLILTGRQATDWEDGAMGLFLAEMLGIPAINIVRRLELEGDEIVAERLKRFGHEVVKCCMPALLTISNEAGDLRLSTIKAIRNAGKKAAIRWRAADIDIDTEKLSRRILFSLSAPPERSRYCIFIDGESQEDKGKNLVSRLRNDGIL